MGMLIFSILFGFVVYVEPNMLNPTNIWGFGFLSFVILFAVLSAKIDKDSNKYNKEIKPGKIKRWKELVDKELDIAYGMSTDEIMEKNKLDIELDVYGDAFCATNQLETRYWNYVHGIYEFWNHLSLICKNYN